MHYTTLREKLLNIGDDLAMSHNGNCYDYTMNRNRKLIIFNCKKDNKEFIITMTFREIESIWYISGRELYQHAIDWNANKVDK